jgi:O-antigen/teichoic acid export membrane protein
VRSRLGGLKRRYGVLLGNVAARVASLISLFVATLLVARQGGPAVVGAYALLRVLPSLLAMVVSAGLPGAITYFLAGKHRADPRLPSTIVAMAAAGGALGAGIWLAATPWLGPLLFPDVPESLILLAGGCVITRLLVVTAKSCSQGADDLPGSNRVIFLEEFAFLPAYGALALAGAHGYLIIVAGLQLADLGTSSFGWARLARRGFFRAAGRPSTALARRLAGYGMRAQVGGIITQLNLRLDFVILSVIAGPAVLGIYAIASKFAELVKILGMALSYVLYPRFTKDGPRDAVRRARRLLPKAFLLTVAVVAPLWLLAGLLIPAFYGSDFEPAVLPARVILLGLLLEGVGGVITGFLYGVGRPGLNSWAMAVGLVGTVALDLLLIPSFEATGAAVASAVAYLAASVALVWFFRRAEHDLGEAPGGGTASGLLRTSFRSRSLGARDERGPVAERSS